MDIGRKSARAFIALVLLYIFWIACQQDGTPWRLQLEEA
jgi:outer membrane lipoprotein-sorting protein